MATTPALGVLNTSGRLGLKMLAAIVPACHSPRGLHDRLNLKLALQKCLAPSHGPTLGLKHHKYTQVKTPGAKKRRKEVYPLAHKVHTLASEFAQIKPLLLNLQPSGLLNARTVSEPPSGPHATGMKVRAQLPGMAPLVSWRGHTFSCGLWESLNATREPE